MNPDSPSDDEDGAVGLGAMVDSQESSGNVPVGRRYIQGALAALANGSTQPFSNSVAPLGPSRNMAMLASPGAPSQQRPFVGTPRPPYQAAQNSLSIRSARASSRQPPSPQGYPVQRYHPYAPPRQSQPIRAQPTLPRYTRYYAQLSPDQLAAEHQPVANASGSPQNDESLEALEEFHQLLAEKNERVRTWLRDIDPRNRCKYILHPPCVKSSIIGTTLIYICSRKVRNAIENFAPLSAFRSRW